MIVLLPVSRYRALYHVASGRPYSAFDRLVLEAITDGQSSLETLEQTFRLHRRVIVESIVTLMEAGWLAFEKKSHKLVGTSEGMRIRKGSGELPRNILVTERKDYLVGERVQGQLAKSSDVFFSSRGALRPYWNQVAVLPTANIPHSLEPGMVVPLLRRSEGEWIRWCGPIDLVRDGADFVVIDVDTYSRTITGLPTKWIPLLREELFDRARRQERQIAEGGLVHVDLELTRLVQRESGPSKEVEHSMFDEWTVDSGLDRLIVGTREHAALLEDRLGNAKSHIVITSTTLDYVTVERLEKSLRAAIARGVRIEVLWGAGCDGGGEESCRGALELLREIEYVSSGRLSVAGAPSRVKANILLSDFDDGLEVIIGSLDWFGMIAGDESVNLSLIFRENGVVARICHLLADLVVADEHLAGGFGVTILRNAAVELERGLVEAAEQRSVQFAREADRSLEGELPDEGVDGVQEATSDSWLARIVVGRQNYVMLASLASEAHRSLVVACNQWGERSEVTFRALEEALERGCERVEVHFASDLTPGAEHVCLGAGLEKLGGLIKQASWLRANIATIDDDTAVVTSFDWLAPVVDYAGPSAGQIGFILRGKGVGPALLERLGLQQSADFRPIRAEYVTGIRVRDIRSINGLEWRVSGQDACGWHVFVGDNGSGKTSLLRALALALIGTEDVQALRQDWATWIRGSEETALVEVELERLSDGANSWPRVRTSFLRWTRNERGATLSGSLAEGDEFFSAGYGPFRRFGGGDPEFERQLASFPKLARHLSLFDERVALTEGLVWLRELRFKSLEEDKEATLLLDRTTKLINESGLLPKGVKLVQVTSEAVFFRDEMGCEYNITELSDGYRSILSLTFDIVRQLAVTFGAARVFDRSRANIVSAPGIVLIDEVDAHLHPSWKRTLGQWFLLHFPRIQFIVSTHSPLVCQAAEGGTVFRLPDPSIEGDAGEMIEGAARARLVYGNILDAYASGAFGDEVTRSEASKRHLHRLAELNQKELAAVLSDEELFEQSELRASLPSTAYATSSGED